VIQVCNVIPPAGHWKGEYFNNKTLSGSPVMTRDDGLAETKGSLIFDWGTASPGSGCGVPADNFSVRWTVTTNLLAYGYYMFGVNVDDGVRVWVNGQLVINKWFDHSTFGSYSAIVNLPAGTTTIKMEYYNGTGAAMAKLSWAPLL
jgi:hypothetical protein